MTVNRASDSFAIDKASRKAAIEDAEKSTGQSTRLNGSFDTDVVSGGTVRTLQLALRTTFSVTEPSINRSNPPSPCVPNTMRSAGSDAAQSRMQFATL
jgi:hypothetical protein